MPIIESTVNAKLTEILRRKNPRWRAAGVAVGEATGGLRGQAGARPDVLIAVPNALPIVLETEFLPARSVEADAVARLGGVVEASGAGIEQVIAVRLPQALREADAGRLDAAICDARLEYCLFSGEAERAVRWPQSGWLQGDADGLAALIENAGISEALIAKSTAILEGGVNAAAATLIHLTADKPAVQNNIAALLHQSAGVQTTRMAMAIIANALTFQELLAGAFDVRCIDDLRVQGARGRLAVGKLSGEWRRITSQINYWPVFGLAREILVRIPAAPAVQVVYRLAEAVDELNALGITTSHDLYGRMFQRLITDRKFLATFYTMPESAMLLAEMAADLLAANYADAPSVGKLRIADFACGTGTLLSAAYHAVLARHRRAGHDDAAIHRAMMEEALVATDVMPAGVHLTVSVLSGVHPTVTFQNTKVHTLPYGRENEQINLGALDLLEKQASRDLLQTRRRLDAHGEVAVAAGNGNGANGMRDLFAMEHESFDWVIMNPPFTRPTNHTITDRPVPSFAGFGTTDEEQKAMSMRLKRINRELPQRAGDGNAGLASNFIDLAHLKLKAGGVLALVLPATFAQGHSWMRSRRLIDANYDDISVISLVSSGAKTTSFSADTDIAEVLLLGKKRAAPRADGTNAQVRFVALRGRPANAAQASLMAKAIAESDNGIRVGDDFLGEIIRGSLANGSAVGLHDPALVATAEALRKGGLMLPGASKKHALPTVRLGDIAARGLLSRDINGVQPDGNPRGPFTMEKARDVPTYPGLWKQDAAQQRGFIVKPDSQGRVRKGMQEKADAVWQTASTLHFNLAFRLTSQSLAACVTTRRTIGGAGWPNVRPHDASHEPAIVLWANSTLGLLLWWHSATRQQTGRAIISLSNQPELPVLDTRALSEGRHQLAAEIFDRFKDKTFLPANEAYHDEARHALDRAVLVELLGLPEEVLEPLSLLRRKWCYEPSVHGGKSTRPQTVE